jgi:hypothetical protein
VQGLIRHFQPEMEHRIRNSKTYDPKKSVNPCWSGAPMTEPAKAWVAQAERAAASWRSTI